MIPNINAVVGIIISIDNKTHSNTVLVSKRRSEQSYGGYWELPGGKIEKQETALSALNRELFEELDINIIKAEYVNTIVNTYPEFIVNLNIYKVISYNGKPIGKEGQELKWCAMHELSSLSPLLPGSIDIINMIDRS